MNKEILIHNNDIEANKLVSKCMRYTIIVVALIWLANQLGIFILDKFIVNIVGMVSIIILLIPTIVVDRLRNEGKWVKYFNIIISLLVTGITLATLGYHSLLMILFPTVLALLYVDKKLMLITDLSTIAVITISHLMSPYVSAVPDDPLVELNQIITYGIIPRVFVYCCIAFILYTCVCRTYKMIDTSFAYSTELAMNKDALNRIITQSQRFYSSRNAEILARLAINAICDIVSSQQGQALIPIGTTLIKDNDDRYCVINQDGKKEIAIVFDGDIIFSTNVKKHIIPIRQEKMVIPIVISPNGIELISYLNNEIILFIVIDAPITCDFNSLRGMLDVLLMNIKLAITNMKLNQDMFKNQVEIIHSLAEISESKSRQTGKHIKRVSEYIRVLGTYYGLDEERCNDLSVASMMHDIGKLLIPDEIIEKPGKLTAEEFTIIKEHTIYGYTLLEHSPGKIMQIARNIALEHHEKWDGTGYMGIEGEAINFESRLMAIVDVFDALVSKRSYKDKWNPQDAYDEIVTQSGKHFDPQVVEVFKICYPKFLSILCKYPD